LVGVAARSLGELPDDVTLPQFRALVVLSDGELRPMGELAEELALHPSTATRLVDRLVDRRLVRRVRAPETAVDRRRALVGLTASGRKVVERVTVRRVADLRRILRTLPADERRAVADAMARFAEAAAGLADASWELGWDRRSGSHAQGRSHT
jgi:DNA-binding MarR family transcriptional regulator